MQPLANITSLKPAARPGSVALSGVGQTFAAHALCPNIPPELKQHYLQKSVGHYGVFNGSRFRKLIVPRIREFIAGIDGGAEPAKPAKLNGSRRSKGA